MPVITLTTDLGGGSYYLAALKGVLHSVQSDLNIIDVTHHTNSFDTRQAAYTLQQAAKYFPEKTIHLLHVNSSESDRRLLVANFNNQHFVMFNNGSGPLIFGNEHVVYLEPEMQQENGSLFLNNIGNVVKQILSGNPNFKAASNVQILRRLQPIIRDGFIRGNISAIDHFGNGITNITKTDFEKFVGRNFEIAINGYKTQSLSADYNGKGKGEFVAFFNSENLLEIAINQGNAEKLFGLKVEGVITVESL